MLRQWLHVLPRNSTCLFPHQTTQCNYFEGLCQPGDFRPIFGASLVFHCCRAAESCWEVLWLQLDVVYRLSSSQYPRYTVHQAKVFIWELPEPKCLFPPWTWVDSPPPQPPPTWLLRLKIAPAVLWCVLSTLQLLHSLHGWWMRHCFSSQCFSKLLWQHI